MESYASSSPPLCFSFSGPGLCRGVFMCSFLFLWHCVTSTKAEVKEYTPDCRGKNWNSSSARWQLGSIQHSSKNSTEAIQNDLEAINKETKCCLRWSNASRCVFLLRVRPWLVLNVGFDRKLLSPLSTKWFTVGTVTPGHNPDFCIYSLSWSLSLFFFLSSPSVTKGRWRRWGL